MATSIAAIAGGVGGVLALLVITILCLWFCISHYKKSRSNKTSETESSAPSAVVEMRRGRSSSSTGPIAPGSEEAMQFRLEDLEQATRNFDKNNLIGTGSFGFVYKGLLSDGTVVAIKRHHGAPRALFSEEVKYLARIEHRHLVSLLGYYQDNGHQMLVYEYVPNGSVANHLYGRFSTVKLEFKQRLSIAVGAAKGLCHLHNQSPPLVHGNFKTANVLVDENLIAKVADAGLSKLLRGTGSLGSSSSSSANLFRDPEIAETGRMFETSDVYSFGVFLLELITGEDSSEIGSSSESAMQWIERRLMSDDIVDHRLEGSFTGEGMRDFMRLVLRCMSMPGRLRPDMEMVSLELEGTLEKEVMRTTTVMGEGAAITLGSQLFK